MIEPLEIGVCTWSLATPDLSSALIMIRKELGVKVAQVGFMDDGYRDADACLKAIQDSGLKVSATCVAFDGEDYSSIARITETGGYRPDDTWEARLAKTLAVAKITADLDVSMLTVHVGFVPEASSDPVYAVMVDRVRQVADGLGEHGVTLIMETGQESPTALRQFIDDVGRQNVGVNFDPANMILYGVGEPIEALPVLSDKILHVHMKDANWSGQPGQQWGEEVILGTGEAEIPRIVSKLRAQGYTGPLVIEREAGNNRLAEIGDGVELLQSLLG
jgi:sugar phosphate isomerase/epimerase